ncbi:MAG TPA: GNAT family N-acetyltransferase [Mycobacteriales bacterium]|nr:GNAT family N-acetyltransferase [Mycobacteriales bacterium]
MQARVIPLADLSLADESKWAALAERAAEPNPYLEPDCVLPAWRHLPEASDLRLVVAEHADQFLACLPIGSPQPWSRLHRAALMGRADTTSILLSTPLVDPAGGLDAVTVLLQGIRDQGRALGAGLLVLDWLGDDGTVGPLLREAAAGLRMPRSELWPWQRPAMFRKADPTEYWLRELGHQHQRKIQQKRRQLAKQIGPLEVVDRAGDPSAVAELIRLEATGWKQTSPEGEAFARREATVRFFTELCERFAASGRLVLLSLQSADRAAAMLCCLRSGEGLFAYRIGFDEALGRGSPGVQVFLDAMAYLHRETDAAFLDSCTTPDNRYLPDLLPDTRSLTTMVIAIGGALDRGFVRALPLLSAAQRASGRTP